MSNDEQVKNNLAIIDGFDDPMLAEDGVEGGNAQQQSGKKRIIHGQRLSFSNDFVWLAGDGEPFPKDREVVVVDSIRVVQKWIDKMPDKNIIVEHGKLWPDLDALNKACPRSEWSKDFNGNPCGPWQRQRVTYFVDLNTMQRYTWPVDTVGASVCISEFRDKIEMMRRYRGSHVYAVVTLGDAFMATRFGGRQRPDFLIKRWVLLGPSGAALPAPSAPALPAQAPPEQSAKPVDPPSGVRTVEPPSLREQMGDDAVPFDDSLPEGVGGAPMPKPAAPPTTPKPAAQKRMTKRGAQKIANAR